MNTMNNQVLRSEVRYRYERDTGLEGDWARIEGWRGSRVRRTRRRVVHRSTKS